MAQITCGECIYFDQKHKGDPSGVPKPLWFGWCAKLSVYPTVDQEGQTSPPDVRRAEAGKPAQPVIVRSDQLIRRCLGPVARNG